MLTTGREPGASGDLLKNTSKAGGALRKSWWSSSSFPNYPHDLSPIRIAFKAG